MLCTFSLKSQVLNDVNLYYAWMHYLEIGDNNHFFTRYTPEEFLSDYKNFIKNDFDRPGCGKLFKYDFYYCRLCAYGILPFVVPDFKENELYTSTIHKIFNSDDMYSRLIAYKLIAGVTDSTFEQDLLIRLDTTNEIYELTEIAKTLMCTKTKHTSELFDCFVKTNYFEDNDQCAPMTILPYFIRLDKRDLLNTFYMKIDNPDTISRITCATIILYADTDDSVGNKLKKVLANWGNVERIYAMYAIKKLRIGNLKEVIEPILSDSSCRQAALELLANSPTKEDREFLYQIAENQNRIAVDIINALANSDNEESLKYWHRIRHTKKLSKDYLPIDRPELPSDDCTIDLIIKSITKEVSLYLKRDKIEELSAFKTDKVKSFLISYAKDEDEYIQKVISNILENWDKN